MITNWRYHDFSYGHRVFGHENKCSLLHGHNGRVHFHCTGDQDSLGRIIDFSVIKERLCEWVEDNWDHRFLVWEEDPWFKYLSQIDPSVVPLMFNPTAENMAKYLLECIGPLRLTNSGVTLIKVVMDETRKCSASAELPFTLSS